MTVQSDGKVVISGDFHNIDNIDRSYLARLNTNGSLDIPFATNMGSGPTNLLDHIIELSDGKLLIGGQSEEMFDGNPFGGVGRLNSDGSWDNSFDIGTGFTLFGFAANINAVAVQSDGKILVGGWFDDFNGTAVNNFVRLNPNGGLNNKFGSGAND